MQLSSASIASYLGRTYPRFSRAALQIFGARFPNLWLFHFLVRECGARVPTYARLGNGLRVKVFLGDIIGCHIWHSGWYEPHLVNALKPFLKPDVTFFDVGANIGQYTLLSAPLVQEVHSFEPFAVTYNLLAWNVKHSGFSNIQLNQFGVSDHPGIATIFEANVSNTGGASLRRTPVSEGNQHTIQTVALDEYVFGSNLFKRLKKVVLKIDIEGAELLALEGSRELLKLKPILVLEALDELQRGFGRSRDELTCFLKSRGYVLLSLTENGPTPYEIHCPNILALPEG